MLRKCLKYDFKSVFSLWIFGAIAMLILSIPGGLALRSMTIHIGEANRFNWEILIVILVYFAIAFFMLFSSILIYVRYYKHFFSDEGYLTFTLPVKRRTLFTSKVINGVIFQSLTGVVIFVSIIIMLLFLPYESGTDIPPVESEPVISALWVLAYILEALALIVIYAFTSILAMYLLITIGANVVRKNKVIATIGIVYASSMVLSALAYVFVFIGVLYGVSLEEVIPSVPSNVELLVFLAIALVIAVLLTVTIGLAMITLRIIEKKLNLA